MSGKLEIKVVLLNFFEAQHIRGGYEKLCSTGCRPKIICNTTDERTLQGVEAMPMLRTGRNHYIRGFGPELPPFDPPFGRKYGPRGRG